MKLHVQPGPLPIAPPYFEWEAEDIDPIETEEEIDLTDLFEIPKPARDVESVNWQAPPRRSAPVLSRRKPGSRAGHDTNPAAS